jgi:hypothetical protein
MHDSDSKQTEHSVELHHAEFGHLGAGILRFGGNRLAEVTFSERIPNALIQGNKYDLIKAVAGERTVFSLCTCEISGHALYADYVIEGDLPIAAFDSISVRYSDVSEWFLHSQHVKGTVGETLTWTQTPQSINVAVKTDEEHFELRSEYTASRTKRGEDLILHEHVEFVFSAKNQRFGPTDIRSKAHEFSCLLSILLAYPATIASVMVAQGQIDRFYRVHFPTFERPARDMDETGFWIRCFIQQHALEGRWQSILDHYYQSKFRKICWTRLAGMQRHKGFWEYKTLGYVSLLDSYLNIWLEAVKRSPPTPPSTKKIAKFSQQLKQDMPTLTAEQRQQVLEIARDSFSSKTAVFEHRFKLAIKDTDTDVVKLINLSDDAFDRIKEVRNAIAHGDAPDLEDNNFTPLMQAEGKIALLLTYWAFLDFGLTTQEFVNCLKITSSRLRLNAALDDVHLARITKSAEFFPVTKEKLRALQNIKELKVFGCCIQDESGALNYSEEFTKAYRDWLNDRSAPSRTHDAEYIFGVHKDNARIVGHGYFECEDEYLSVQQMWVITHSI